MTGLPSVLVEVAFATAPDAVAPAWVDITAFVRMTPGITISRGRQDEFSTPQPGRLSLTLDNTDGRFTFANVSSPYFPNVLPYRRIRVSVIVAGNTFRRFDGYVDGWPVAWQDASATVSLISIGATDRLSRLSNLRTLRHPIIEQLGAPSTASWYLDSSIYSVLDSTTILGDGPAVLYGLQESAGSVTAGDSTGINGRPTLTLGTAGSGGGTVAFGTSGIMPEGAACLFTPASTGNGQVLQSSTLSTYLGGNFAFFAVFAWSGSTLAQIAQTTIGQNSPSVALTVTPSNVTVKLTPATGSPLTLSKATATNDGRVHFVCVSVSGATTSIYVDSLPAATGTTPAGMGTSTGLQIGSTSDPVQVAWVGVMPRALSSTEISTLSGLATGANMASDAWVSLWATWLGISSDLAVESGLSNVAYMTQNGAAVLDLVNLVNEVELGVLVAKGTGKFAYQSRSHRYNRPVSLTLSASVGNIAPGLAATVDMIHLLNSVSYSRPSGATYRAQNAASVANYGIFQQSKTIYAATDTDLFGAANWVIYRYGQVESRFPKIETNLLNATDVFAISAMAVEIGDHIQATNLPSQSPAALVDVFVEGLDESYSAASFLLGFATSPGTIYSQVWTLDSASTSQLGTTTTLAY